MTAQPQVFFRTITDALQAALLVAMPEDTAVVFEVSGTDGGTWTVARVGDELRVNGGDHRSPDCRLVCTAPDFEALVTGVLHPQDAFFDGRIAVEGDVGLALALRDAVSHELRRAS